MKSMALYGERKAFYDTKTTCFAVVETSLIDRASRAYRLKVACLWLAPLLLIARALRAYYSWAVCLLHVTCVLIACVPSAYCLSRTYMFFFEKILQYCHPTLEIPLFKVFSGWWQIGGSMVVFAIIWHLFDKKTAKTLENA